jgi:WD40 repeat protein
VQQPAVEVSAVAAFRMRRRVILWSLLVLFLVGLGVVLNARLRPQPRSAIPGSYYWVKFLSDDGATILTSDNPDFTTYQTWDTLSGENHGKYLVNPGIHVISPGGRFLAALNPKRDLDLVDLKLGRQSKNILGFSEGSAKLVFSLQANYLLAVQSENHEIQALYPHRVPLGNLVDCHTGRVVKTLRDLTFFHFTADENIFFRIAPAGRLGNDGILTHWDPRTRKTIRTFKDVEPLELSVDGQTLLAQSVDNGLFLLDLADQKVRPLDPAAPYSQNPPHSAFSPDGKTLITFPESFPDPEIVFWDVASGKRRGKGKRPDLSSGKVPGLFSPDSSFFLLTCPVPVGPRLSLWETASGRCLWKRDWKLSWLNFGGGYTFPADVRIPAGCPCLFVARDGRFEILDFQTGETKHIFHPRNLGERNMEFTRDGTYYSLRESADQGPGFLQELLGDWWPANTDENQMKVKVVETATGRIVSQLQGPYGNGHLSKDGRTLVTAYRGPHGEFLLRCWDLPLRPPLRLVIGIPLGIGLLFVLATWWRGWRAKRLAA